MKEIGTEKMICPNCDNEFESSCDFCPHCGQRNKPLNLNFRYFLHDFISSSFNIDSKIFSTLRVLILQPGELTKEFLAGKRMKYIPPVRLYLILSLVYFTLLSLISADIVKIKDSGDEDNTVIDSTQSQVDGELNTATNTLNTVTGNDSISQSINKDETKVITMDNLGDLELLIDRPVDSLKESAEAESWFRRFAQKRLKKLGTDDGKEAFQELMRKYISIGMFILMPITALIFFILFYRGTYYIQHLVFVLHLQSMMYILFTFLNLLELAINTTIMDVLGIILFLFLLLMWIKKFYEIRWWRTVWKTFLFLFLFGFSFFIFLATVAAVSAFNL